MKTDYTNKVDAYTKNTVVLYTTPLMWPDGNGGTTWKPPITDWPDPKPWDPCNPQPPWNPNKSQGIKPWNMY